MPSLSRKQFSQPELPGMPERIEMPEGHHTGVEATGSFRDAHVNDYSRSDGLGAWSAEWTADDYVDNPLFDATVEADAFRGDQTIQRNPGPYEFGRGTEFVPTYEVRSPQKQVNRHSVAHLTANANTNDLAGAPIDIATFPDTTTGRDQYMVEDGNHRVNAALNQGRLIIPASVAGWRPPSQQPDDWQPYER